MLDLDAWSERAAIMEYEGGLSRFKAETLAAEAQGATRWQALEAMRNADGKRNSECGGDLRSALDGQQRADHMPGVQRTPEKEKGSVLKRDQNAGRDRLELLALQSQRRGVL